ncbi:MAG TPA: tripartite tricarboxylate transporter substrate binding protein [Xanthobacteraceae bacterium]|nr:tripartite tricarboxylate transporter substrate binding protein [Xanthobacteraceae bacterium]
MAAAKLMRRVALIVAVALAAATTAGARAETATIRIIVPLPAGGGVDVVARELAEVIARTTGAIFVIENRPGAGTIIGTEAAARAAPDGNTLLLVPNSFVVAPQLHKVNYDALTGFAPICSLVATPTVLVVNPASPYRTLGAFVAAAQAAPGRLTVASVAGAALQVSFAMLQEAARIQTTFVSYPGTPPAITALLGNHVDAAYSDFPTVAEQIKSGAVRALATGARARLVSLPDVPTVAEAGYPGYEADIWYGLFAPAKTPRAVIARLAGWFAAALEDPAVKAKLVLQGLRPAGLCGTAFGDYVRRQYQAYGEVIRKARIRAP